MNKILAIVGPTGTGKTERAIEEAQKKASILVSADSRQVYKGMDIVTGKDQPSNVTLYGINLVSPDELCSVAVWYDAVMPHVKQAWLAGKQVIVVGGTGLYIRALTNGIETMVVPPNDLLRQKLTLLSLVELQNILKQKDRTKFEAMNESDQKNPRRLIRAIEIVESGLKANTHTEKVDVDIKIIGLKNSNADEYKEAVRQRVMKRLKLGAVDETRMLLSTYDKNLPAMSAIGYRSVIKYLEDNISEEEMIKQWTHDEINYAKRQLTWFTKVPKIKWYDRKKEE
jgi:tRNA dimethylallyltransferase